MYHWLQACTVLRHPGACLTAPVDFCQEPLEPGVEHVEQTNTVTEAFRHEMKLLKYKLDCIWELHPNLYIALLVRAMSHNQLK